MQKSGYSLCKSETPLYKKIPSEKNLLLRLASIMTLNILINNQFLSPHNSFFFQHIKCSLSMVISEQKAIGFYILTLKTSQLKLE